MATGVLGLATTFLPNDVYAETEKYNDASRINFGVNYSLDTGGVYAKLETLFPVGGGFGLGLSGQLYAGFVVGKQILLNNEDLEKCEDVQTLTGDPDFSLCYLPPEDTSILDLLNFDFEKYVKSLRVKSLPTFDVTFGGGLSLAGSYIIPTSKDEGIEISAAIGPMIYWENERLWKQSDNSFGNTDLIIDLSDNPQQRKVISANGNLCAGDTELVIKQYRYVLDMTPSQDLI